MKMEKDKTKQPVVNMFSFEDLVKRVVKQAGLLTEYFRLNFIYYQLISGKGLEFDKIKDYVAGDDPRRIDWKIYARTGKLKIRAYKEERELEIIIIVDSSSSMLLGTTEYTKAEYAAVLAGIVAFAAIEAGDVVGGGTVTDKHMELVDPEGDFVNLLSEITKKEHYGGRKSWEKLATELVTNYNENSILFIISDFIETNPHHFLPDLSNHFAKVFGVMIKDPIDYELPKELGKMFLRDPQTGEVVLTDVKHVQEEYNLLSKQEIQHIKDAFHQYGQLCFTISTGEDFTTTFIKAMGDEQVEIS
jgi:hypothetical protein